MRQTNVRRVLVGGKTRRMSARWSSRAGRLISTRPASAAPHARFTQQFSSLLLGLLPSGYGPLQEPPPLVRKSERLRAGVLLRDRFEPALRHHPVHVPAESRDVQVQKLTDLGGPSHAELRGD